jgi:hypothetical protein
VLAAALIHDDLQVHLALACVGEQSSLSTPTPLPVRTTGTSGVALPLAHEAEDSALDGAR